MANLIIKPSAGGQLILKDEGDDAAITVATNGTTTLSGSANNLGTISTATTFPAGHVIETYNKQFYESIYTTSGSVIAFGSSNDLAVGTVEAGVTIVAQISGGSIRNRNSTNNSASGSVATALIGPTSDFTTYRGSGARVGGGSSVDMDIYGSAIVMGARYFASQTASVVIRGACYELGSRTQIAWESSADAPITVWAWKIMGDQGITIAT
jgi:hypothetical protein